MSIWIFRTFVIATCPAIVYFYTTKSLMGALLGLLVGVLIVAVEMVISRVSLLTMISGVLGAASGLIVAKLLDYTVFQMGNDSLYLAWDRYAALRYFALGVLGLIIAIRKFPEFDDLDKDLFKMGRKRGAELKVLDTSAIIDGRVIDICDTKFLSGTLIVPRFILQELHTLADSADSLKRARGRRGLDILARLQENPDIPVKILDKDVPDVSDVDGKVVRLGKDLGAKVITTDFNLNKIAALEGVTCLNVNDLGMALKPIVLPGEAMALFVMKEGKERDQGVGYLDDGTMVVIEDGRRFIGKRLEVGVTSILQTSAGRMIFARAKGEKAA
ncbi:MAG: PIN domain nuclease [Elusimicrobia bacterium]|nr:PIN domain nuclease [Elusimicrobiota bacterium]MDE2424570.1 PIN domain nuclease [Elusimicrobiota bacterium]